MGEVVASVAMAEAAPAVPAPTGEPKPLSFVDGDGGADPADAILDEVLAGETPAEGDKPAEDDKTPAETPAAKPAEAKPDAKPAEPAAEPPTDIEAAKLRRGFAKLAEKEQKALELQAEARGQIRAAQQFEAKARAHDELVAQIDADPAGFLLARGGEALVQKALQGFIDQEKSPAEREVAKFRAEQTERDRRAAEQQTIEQVNRWKADVIGKVQASEDYDLVNSLGLQHEVIDLMTAYAEKHSERDSEGRITKPAILPWDQAAKAIEDHRAAMIEKSKRYGKRTPAAPEAAKSPGKDAQPAKPATAPAKRAPTSLSSVPVADAPARADELSLDPDERERQVLAELGV